MQVARSTLSAGPGLGYLLSPALMGVSNQF